VNRSGSSVLGEDSGLVSAHSDRIRPCRRT
jgi:hypothetical protein